jgi:predicted MFS family arabinose efflux permease
VSIGPIVGGALTEGLSWRWIFLVNVPIGALALTLALTRIEESRDPAGSRLDIPGFIAFTTALAALVFGLIEAGRRGWGSSVVIACLIGSAALISLFVAIERRTRLPMLDLGLFRRPAFAGASMVAFAMSASIFSMFLYLTLYLQNILGYSPLGAGLRVITLSGAIFISAGLAGRLTTVVPVRLLMGAGLTLVGIGLLLMRGIAPASHWTHLLAGFIISGVGIGLVNPPLASTAIGVVPPQKAGMGSGINSTFRQVGIATGIAALGTIFTTQVRSHVTAGLHAVHQAGAGGLASAIANGQAAQALAHVPAGSRAAVAAIARSSFVAGLNDVLLVAAFVAFAGAVGGFSLIRSQDFVTQTGGAPPAAPEATATPAGAAA